MKLTILGSGAWQGIPAPFCLCAVCRLAMENPNEKNFRMRPQLLIEIEHGAFLLEVSPDIRVQSTKFHVPPVKDFVVSHWHFDHMYGLHELLTWMKQLDEKPTVHCSAGTKEKINQEFAYLPLSAHALRPFEPFMLFDVAITPLPVYHMFARDEAIPDGKLENTFGYLLERNGKRVAYLADYYRIPQSTRQRLQGVDILVADGTYLMTHEHEMRKPNHLHGDAIVRFTKSTQAKAVYFHSISHLTGKTHEQLQAQLPLAHYLTYDGLQLELE